MLLKNRFYIKKENINPNVFRHFTYYGQDTYTKDDIKIETFKDYNDYFGFGRGDLQKIYDIWGEDNIVDRRDVVPMKYPLKFTGVKGKGYEELKPEQRVALKQWLGFGYGLVQAPPRWGKSVWLAALTCALKQKTIIFAHTIDLVNQLEEEFRAWTNINELEALHGKKLIGNFRPGQKRFYPLITFSTWQYLNNHLNFLKAKSNKVGFVAVDEAHRVSAECYTRVITSTNSYYRLGITATPTLKSGLDVIVYDILGPVTVISETEMLRVTSNIIFTNYTLQAEDWGKYLTIAAAHEGRNIFISEQVLKDVKSNHVVLITTDRVKHTTLLKNILISLEPSLRIKIITGKTKEKDRISIRNSAKLGEIDIVIAMNSIVQLGWNVPRLSVIHNTMPIANVENWYQRLSRVRTPYVPTSPNDDYIKPNPICRIYVDDYVDGMGIPVKGIKYGYMNTIKKVADRIECEVTYGKRQ